MEKANPKPSPKPINKLGTSHSFRPVGFPKFQMFSRNVPLLAGWIIYLFHFNCSVITKVSTELEDAVQFLRQIKEKIPQQREGDAQLYLQLLKKKRSKNEIQKIYEPLKQIRLLQRSLTVYNVTEVRKSAFTDEELNCDESIVGEGSFSTVYKGVLFLEGQPEFMVALKRYRDPLATNNVWHFLDEERALW